MSAAHKLAPAAPLDTAVAPANDTLVCRVSCTRVVLEGVPHHRVEAEYQGTVRYSIDLAAAKYGPNLARTAGESWARARGLRVVRVSRRRERGEAGAERAARPAQ